MTCLLWHVMAQYGTRNSLLQPRRGSYGEESDVLSLNWRRECELPPGWILPQKNTSLLLFNSILALYSTSSTEPRLSVSGEFMGKSLFPGKKWGTSECLSANLQTGNQTRFPINLKAMKHTIFQRFFKSKRGKWGRKTIFIITSLHPCYSVLLHVENHETDESDITGHSATRHPVSGSAWKSGVPVWDDTFHDSF